MYLKLALVWIGFIAVTPLQAQRIIPAITSVDPNPIPVQTAGTGLTVTIYGRGLLGSQGPGGTTVLWSGSSLRPSINIGVGLTVFIPRTLLSRAGNATVSISVSGSGATPVLTIPIVMSTAQLVVTPIPDCPITPGNSTAPSPSGTLCPTILMGRKGPGGSITLASTGSALLYQVSIEFVTPTQKKWLSASPVSGTAFPLSSEVSASVALAVDASGLPVGTYTAIVQIDAYAQSLPRANAPEGQNYFLGPRDRTRDAADTPVDTKIVPVTATVQGTSLQTFPTILSFSYLLNGLTPARKDLRVSLSPPGGLTAFTAAVTTPPAGSWLSVSPPAGSTPGTISVAVQPAGLPVGTYWGTIRLQGTGASANPIDVDVALNVIAQAAVQVRFPDYTIGGAAPPDTQVQISSPALNEVAYYADAFSDQGWLQAVASIDETPSMMVLSASPATVSAGSRRGFAVATNQYVPDAAVLVEVLWNVMAPAVAPSQLFPHFADGGEWQTEFLLTNPNPVAVTAEVQFHMEGPASGLNVEGIGSAPSIRNITIQPNGSIVYRTAGLATADTVSGWASVTSSLPLNGTALFRRHAADGKYYEGSIPLTAPSSTFSLPFDGTTFTPAGATTQTGLALANTSASTTARVSCLAYGTNGVLLNPGGASFDIALLSPLDHTSLVLQSTAAVRNVIGTARGVLACNSTTPVAALGLRALGAAAISSLPVQTATLTAGSLMFPHFADGGEWQTEFLLTNPNPVAVTAEVQFHMEGPASGLNVEGMGVTPSIRNITIQANGSIVYRTAGLAAADTVSGWASVTSSLPLNGTALFRRHAADGKYYEGSIPPTAPSSTFSLPFDGTTFTPAGAVTQAGLAIANTSASATARVSCLAYGTNGVLLNPGGASFDIALLSPLGHTSLVLQSTAAVRNVIGTARGVLACSSTAPVAALGLRALGTAAISSLPVSPK